MYKRQNKEIKVTPFGVDINKFYPNKVESDEIIIGTIKTLEEKYGVQYLVKAFKQVKEENKDLDIKLRIGGKGSQEDYLKNLCRELNIENDVTFLGFVKPDDVIKEFQRFDISVFPSTLDSESFGVAAVESEACGTPVIVSNVGGLMESTKPNETSLVVEKKSVEDLAEKLNILVRDKDLRIKMGKAARKFVEDNYSLEKNFEYINPTAASVMSVFWPTVSCLYLCISFLTFDWHVTWIIWLVAALIYNVLKSFLCK